MSSLLRFLKLIWKNTGRMMTGSLLVAAVLAIAGTIWQGPVYLWIFFGAFILCVLIACFLGWKEQDEQLRLANDKRQIREKLGQVLAEGQKLIYACCNEKDAPPEEEVNDWSTRTIRILQADLGEAFATRFQNSAGIPQASCGISSEPHRNLWGRVRMRMARLDQFISELS